MEQAPPLNGKNRKGKGKKDDSRGIKVERKKGEEGKEGEGKRMVRRNSLHQPLHMTFTHKHKKESINIKYFWNIIKSHDKVVGISSNYQLIVIDNLI